MHVTYEYTCALMHALVCQSIAAGKVVYLDIMTIGCLWGYCVIKVLDTGLLAENT